MQGELEHRLSKARYKRTDKKQFVRQLTQIERREHRLRRIRVKLSAAGLFLDEPVVKRPQEHHHIGISQDHYEHVGSFLQRNSGDPAIKVGAVMEMTQKATHRPALHRIFCQS
jgi:hypothetical protein